MGQAVRIAIPSTDRGWGSADSTGKGGLQSVSGKKVVVAVLSVMPDLAKPSGPRDNVGEFGQARAGRTGANALSPDSSGRPAGAEAGLAG